MVLITALNILFSKLSSQEDIVIGTSVGGRRHADLQQVIGMFVNTLALRNYSQGEKKIAEFLEDVKRKTLKAFENQEYQFEDLLEKVAVEKDTSRNPLFDVMFSWLDMLLDTEDKSGLRFSTLDNKYNFETRSAKFDMHWMGSEKDGELFFLVNYCSKLFKEETILTFIDYYKKIISVMGKSPHLKISEMEIISEEEKKTILHDFNDTKVEFPRSKAIHQLFEEQVEITPGRTALVGQSAGRKAQSVDEKCYALTYRELNEKSNQLAHVLREKGFQCGTIAILMVERSIEMIIGIMGILKTGGAYLPIDPDYPQERVDYILKDSSARILLTNSSEGSIFNLPLSIVNCQSSMISAGESFHHSGNIAYVIYTSGTTGKPKGVMIEHHSLVNRLNWMQKTYPLDERDTIMQQTTFTFDVSVWEIFWWALVGARVCPLLHGGEKDPGIIVDTIEKHHITTIHFVPSMLSVFLEYLKKKGDTRKLSSLKQVIASGEELTAALVGSFKEILGKKHFTKLANLYGPTEASIYVSYYNCVESRDLQKVPIGKPIDNIKLWIIDKHFRLQPVSVPGELCISGVGLARGYLNRPELTAEKLIIDHLPLTNDRLYKTGDLARWLPDGNIEFLGRIDHQVKIRGFRVELGEIEHHLLKHENVKEIVVMARAVNEGNVGINQGNEKYLYAYLVSEIEVSVSELKSYLAGKLPEYMLPSYFIRVDNIPLTANGKIDRKALDSFGTRLETSEEFIAPQNDIEKKIAHLWKELLHLHKVGINDNFFDLGGTSLDMINLSTKLNETFNINESVMVLFRYTTIHSFANYLSRKKEGVGIPDAGKNIIHSAALTFDKVKESRRTQRNKRRGKINGTN